MGGIVRALISAPTTITQSRHDYPGRYGRPETTAFRGEDLVGMVRLDPRAYLRMPCAYMYAHEDHMRCGGTAYTASI